MTGDSARRWYRRLLHLAPPRLRARHGAEMEEAFLHAWGEARGAGPLAAAGVWLRAAGDLLMASLRALIGSGQRAGAFPSERRSWMLGTELRYAFRSFRRQRSATALVVTMLTLGIAANIVVFSLINSLFLRPFQFAEPDRLVYFNERAPRWNLERVGINYPDFVQWRKDARVFESLALYSDTSFNLADDQGALRILGGQLTYDFLTVVGLRPIVGRFFTAEEDRPNAARVTVISERMWRDRFGADPSAVGKTLRLNGIPHEIVGVLPRAAEFPFEALAWVPLAGDPNQEGQSYSWDGIGRLKPGVSAQEAETDLLRAHQPIWETKDKDKNVSPLVRPLREELVQDFGTIATALFAAVTLLLAIACANVAAVMLARAIARRREMGIRLAVGANRLRLLRQLFVENVLLAIFGGIAGVAVGRWAFHLLVTSVGDGLPYWVSPALDGRIVAFSVLLTVATTVLFGWAPALHAVRGDLRSAMNDSVGGTTASPGGRRTLTWLVAAEFTIASILLAGGGLLFRAFDQVRHVNPGFSADHVLTFSVALPSANYKDGPARIAFWDRLLERLRATPGVEAASVITCPPLSCHWGNFYRIEGRPPLKPGESNPVVLTRVASDGYFESMKIRLKAGRFFTPEDGRTGSPQVVIVNENFVRTFWPTETDVIGKRIAFNGPKNPWMDVIGVTGEVKHYGLEQPMRPGLYFPAQMLPERTGGMAVMIRTAGDPEAFTPTARLIVQQLDPTLPLYRIRTMEQALARSMQTRAVYSWMLAVFAGLALVLALGGTYGVTSYLVTQRTREIGIRMAMGAGAADIVRSILRGSLTAIVIGMVLGLASVVGLARLLGDMLFGVPPHDPLIHATAAVALILAAILANWLPARRAARTDPMVSLKI
ncbi:MAG TPA: ABC transporter permease [Vicinamibacterales bacterium]|nr:ABC transporter permease [Vicinamibacterales bacterium]